MMIFSSRKNAAKRMRRNNGRRAFAPRALVGALLVLAMIVSMPAGAIAASGGESWGGVDIGISNSTNPIAEGSGGLGSFVDQVLITDKDGNPVEEGGTLYVGENYHIELWFKEKGAQNPQFTWTADGKMFYQMPRQFKISAHPSQDLYVTIDGKSVKVGTYSVDENGLMTIQLDDAGKAALDSANNVALNFNMDATAQFVEGSTDQDVHFGDTGEDFTFKVTDQPRIKVDKKSAYDKDTEVLSYTVSTTVEHGPVHGLVVNDTLTPPESKGITLEMMTAEGGKPAVTVTVIRNGVPVTLTEADYELVPITDPDHPSRQIFEVRLKEGGAGDPLNTGEELLVEYKYQAKFDPTAADIYWGQVVNTATVTGSMPVEDPATHQVKDVPVEQDDGSYAEVYRRTTGDGVVSKDEAYSEYTGKLHYTLYAAVKAGEYTPFFLDDTMTVEYAGKTWTVDTKNIDFGSMKVYAQDVTRWESTGDNDIPDELGPARELTGFDTSNTRGYDSSSMNNYVRNRTDSAFFILFGYDAVNHPEGYWKCDTDRLITVEYDLDVSGGLTLHEQNGTETRVIGKDDVLLAGITNTVHLRYDHYYPGFTVFFSNGEKLNKTGRLNKTDNTIDYTVTLDLKDTTVWDYMKDVYSKVSKYAEFCDDFDDNWEYVGDSLKATVYTKWGSSTVYNYDPDNEKCSWLWKGESVDSNFSGGVIDAYLWGFCTSDGLLLPWYFDPAYDGQVERIEFTYILKASDEWVKKHAADWDPTNIHNEAAIKDKDSTHWDAKADVPYIPAKLTKTAEQVGTSNLLKFTLKVNPSGADLDKEHEFLYVTDTSENLQIVLESIQVLDAAGEEVKFRIVSSDGEGQFKLEVPDCVALTIQYNALIPEKGVDVKVSNKASIDGVAQSEDGYDKYLQVDNIDGGGSGSTYTLTVKKADKTDAGKKLPGATFRFYIVVTEGSVLDTTENARITTRTINGKEYRCYSEDDWLITTDENGSAKIEGNSLLGPGNYYVLEETVAPAGYAMLKEPILLYYGARNDVDEENYPGAEFALPNGTFEVDNTPVQSLRVVKQGSVGGESFTLAGAQFALYNANEGEPHTAEGEAIGAGTSRADDGYVVWEDSRTELQLEPGKYYVLKETAAPDGYALVEGDIVLQATEDGIKTVGELPEGVTAAQDGELVLALTVVDPSGYVLPESGGTGTMGLYVSGSVLLLAAGLALVCRSRRGRAAR